jgi:predicted NUDIX family NTP pyrophosphohydrolase
MTNTYKCAGILCYAIEPKTQNIYFLLGKESYDGTWSDFAGGPKHGERKIETAIREFSEETMGMVIPVEELIRDLDHELYTFLLDADNRVTYVKQIPFEPDLPLRFANHRMRNFADLPKELLEKSEIGWFSINRLNTLLRHDKIAHISTTRLRRIFTHTLQLVLDLFALKKQQS